MRRHSLLIIGFHARTNDIEIYTRYHVVRDGRLVSYDPNYGRIMYGSGGVS